ncbi:MAG: phosphatidate cytidylyltransferase [Planctomycetes bacterium]|nr:phosphatidate cytidylyltransferase [Planctomycetota bacterium]
MELPGETWQQMLLLVWAVLLAAAAPLGVLSLVRRRRGKPVKPMWIKYASWFALVPAMTVPMLLGRVWAQAAFLAASLYAFEEYARLVGLRSHRLHLWLARVCIAAIYVPVFLGNYGLFTAMPAYLLLPVLLLPILRDTYEGMLRVCGLTLLGLVYFGWFLAHLAFLVNADTGRQWVIAFLMVVVVNDASAYLVGSNLGRRPLSPNLSPNKTVEGFLGAAVITVGATFAVRFALSGLAWPWTLLLGLVLALAGTCGDLAVSLIKRDVHAKDSGWLIPGHGGLLDRLDSILFAAPVFFHFMRHYSAQGTLP